MLMTYRQRNPNYNGMYKHVLGEMETLLNSGLTLGQVAEAVVGKVYGGGYDKFSHYYRVRLVVGNISSLFVSSNAPTEGVRVRRRARMLEMWRKYMEGATYTSIARQYELSRSRANQLVKRAKQLATASLKRSIIDAYRAAYLALEPDDGCRDELQEWTPKRQYEEDLAGMTK